MGFALFEVIAVGVVHRMAAGPAVIRNEQQAVEHEAHTGLQAAELQVAGGAVGYLVSGKAATQLVEEHRNFLIRKWSIETVLEAARTDTENTRFDLLLSKRALDVVRSEPLGPAAIGKEGAMHLSEFRERAEGRALVLHEVIPVVADDPVAAEQLSELLHKQVTMLRDMRRNIGEIEKNHD